MKSDLDEERAWWAGRDLSFLTNAERQAVIERFCLGRELQYRTLQEVAAVVGCTAAHVLTHIKKARVKVDRDALNAAGLAMQLKYDKQLAGNLRIRTSGNRKCQDTLCTLDAIGISTFNQLLDKSRIWLAEGCLGWATTDHVRTALRHDGLFLRGEVSTYRYERTPQPYTITP